MKKHIILTTLAAMTLLTGCTLPNKSIDGKYVDVYSPYNMAPDYHSDPDAALEKIVTKQHEMEHSHSETITLKDDQFTIVDHLDSVKTATWNGTFSNENSLLKFQYSDVYVEGTKNQQRYTDLLPALNEQGVYPQTVAPSVFLADITRCTSRLPFYLCRARESWSLLETHGEFLCTPTYGFTLDGEYEHGKAFTVNYEPMNTLLDDPYSELYFRMEDGKPVDMTEDTMTDWLSMYTNTFCDRYGVESEDALHFRLTFSDGNWEMQDRSLNLISKGTYIESQKYPGFIVMNELSDDPQLQEHLDNIYPPMIYIENNTIYYPELIRTQS